MIEIYSMDYIQRRKKSARDAEEKNIFARRTQNWSADEKEVEIVKTMAFELQSGPKDISFCLKNRQPLVVLGNVTGVFFYSTISNLKGS